MAVVMRVASSSSVLFVCLLVCLFDWLIDCLLVCLID